MKKVIVVLMVIVFVAGIILISNSQAIAAWGRKDKDKEEGKVEEVVGEEATSDTSALLYTFKSEEEMTEFEQLYVSKQATFGRIGVLQAYFAMEQNNITEIDKRMSEQFGFQMDATRMYDLNRESLEIRDLGPIAPPATE